MKKQYLLDTNILSGLLSKDPFYLKNIQNYTDGNWAISAITEFELFLYKEKYGLPSQLFREFLKPFIIYPLDTAIFETAAQLFIKRNQPKPHMADLLIAATSIIHHLPLITADEGIQKYDYTEVILLK